MIGVLICSLCCYSSSHFYQIPPQKFYLAHLLDKSAFLGTVFGVWATWYFFFVNLIQIYSIVVSEKMSDTLTQETSTRPFINKEISCNF